MDDPEEILGWSKNKAEDYMAETLQWLTWCAEIGDEAGVRKFGERAMFLFRKVQSRWASAAV